MILTYHNFGKIVFPAFKLPSSNWSTVDGLVFLDGKILDDRNMEGQTLGARRLQTPFSNLINLKKCVTSAVGLIKNAESAYIDNAGHLFLYKKTLMVPLRFYQIRKILRKEVSSVLWVHGINFGIRIPRPPPSHCNWAGFLHIQNQPWMLYEYSSEKPKDTRRKI